MVDKNRGKVAASWSGGALLKNQRLARDSNGNIVLQKESSPGRPLLPSKEAQPAVKPEPQPKAVSFEIKLPSFRRPKLSYKQLDKRVRYGLAAALVAVVLAVGVVSVGKHFHEPPATSTADGVLGQTMPNYKPLVPEKTNNSHLDYDSQRSVTSFKDTIAGVAVTVSEQVLPATFKDNPSEGVEKIAKGFNANKLVDAPEVKVFSGISPEDGSETVVFTKQDLLIFIHAARELDNTALVQYVTGLQ